MNLPIDHFDEELLALLYKHRETPPPTRCESLFIAMIALAEGHKGTQLTIDEVAKLCSEFTRHLLRARLVKNAAS